MEVNIQDEMAKIHHKFGVSEKANYEIQLFIDKYSSEMVIKELHSIKKLIYSRDYLEIAIAKKISDRIKKLTEKSPTH